MLAALLLLLGVGTLTSCHRHHYPTVLIYDQTRSSFRAIPNLNCIPSGEHNVQAHLDCEAEARADVTAFSIALDQKLQTSSECQGLEIVIDAGEQNTSSESERLQKLRERPYWRLRVDYRPRLESQPFELQEVAADGKAAATVGSGGSLPKDIAPFVCKLSKDGPPVDYW